MNTALKYGLIATALGIGGYAIYKSSQKDEETEFPANNSEIDFLKSQISVLNSQIETAIKKNTVTLSPDKNFIVLPKISYTMLTGEIGDTKEQRMQLLNYILRYYPQECIFTGFYKPDFVTKISGYKYATNSNGVNYIGIRMYSIARKTIETFGYMRNEYFAYSTKL